MRVHPRHGPHHPARHTPRQSAGSLRRTTSIDLLRPDGPNGEVVVDGRGRDRLSARDGTPRVLDEAHLHARLDYTGGCTLRDIDTASGAGDLRALHGTAVARGSGPKSRPRHRRKPPIELCCTCFWTTCPARSW